MKIYVVYTAEEGSPPEPVFAFHAKSLASAKAMKKDWALRNSIVPGNLGVEENPQYREGGCPMRDDYVEHPRGSRFLDFYRYNNEDDNHPSRWESHLMERRINRDLVHSLLEEVSETTFDGKGFTIENTMASSFFNLAAVSGDGSFIVARERR